MLESGFTLTPHSPSKNDSDFLNRWNNTKSKEVYFDYSKYTGGDYTFIDNNIQGGMPEQDLEKYSFRSDNPSIQKLLAKNHMRHTPTKR